MFLLFNRIYLFRRRENKATETRAREKQWKERGCLMKFNIRGFPRFVSAGMRRGACFASSIKKQESLLANPSWGQRTFNFALLPCAAAVTLIFINADHPRGRFSSISLSLFPSSSFRLRIKRNPVPRDLLLPLPSREKKKEKEEREERNA